MKAPGEGLPMKVADIKPVVPTQPPKIPDSPVQSTPAPDTTAPRIITEDDARALARVRAQLAVADGKIADTDVDAFVERETTQILEQATASELEKPQGGKEAETVDASQTSAPTALREQKNKELTLTESSEKTEAEDWADTQEAFGANPDPIEGSAVYQVIGANDANFWDTSQSTVDAYLTAHGVTNITPEVRDAEIIRRQEIQEAVAPFKQIATAETVADKEIEEWVKTKVTETEPAKIEVQKTKIREAYAADIQKIQDKYYTCDEKSGEYTIDPNGARIKVSIKSHTRTIVGKALKDLAEDASNPKRQAKARKNYDVLRDRIRDDGSFEPKKPKTAQEIEAEKNKEAESEVISLSYDIVGSGHQGLSDESNNSFFTVTHDPTTGADIITVNQDAVVDKLRPNHPLARLSILVSFHNKLPDTPQNAKARGYLTALMHQELIKLDGSAISMNGDSVRKLQLLKDSKDTKYFDDRMNELKKMIRTVAHLPENYNIDDSHILTDLLLANACEDLDLRIRQSHTAPDLPRSIEDAISQLAQGGFVSENDRLVITGLAENKRAGELLRNTLGIDITDLKASDASTRIARHTVTAINNRRKELGLPEFPTEVQQQMEAVAKQNFDKAHIEKVRELHIPGWLSGLGLVAILLLPAGQSLAEEGVEKGGGGGGGGGGG